MVHGLASSGLTDFTRGNDMPLVKAQIVRELMS